MMRPPRARIFDQFGTFFTQDKDIQIDPRTCCCPAQYAFAAPSCPLRGRRPSASSTAGIAHQPNAASAPPGTGCARRNACVVARPVRGANLSHSPTLALSQPCEVPISSGRNWPLAASRVALAAALLATFGTPHAQVVSTIWVSPATLARVRPSGARRARPARSRSRLSRGVNVSLTGLAHIAQLQ